jgi:hypothetical protein
MASDVDIANLALSHIGDDAAVVALAPPDGSVQAALCARFWPIARAELLEVFEWAFAAKRATGLAATASDSDAWGFRYALPADCLKVRKVLAQGETDENKGTPFLLMERNLYTNEEAPTLIYTVLVTDPTKFTPTFVATAAYLLASYLCGPILKKASAGQAYYDMAMQRAKAAAAINANAATAQQHDAPASWMAQR